jgi:hypothetical protein
MIAEETVPEQVEAFRRVGLSYIWDVPDNKIRITAENVKDGNDITAEVLIEDLRTDPPKYISAHKQKLLDIQSRRNFASGLSDHVKDDPWLRKVNWRDVFEQFCVGTVRRFRTGDPTQHINNIKHTVRRKDLIDKLLPDGKPTLWYGPQGAGKGWLCCHAAVSVASGVPFGHLSVSRKTPVLYLDWEDNEETFVFRVDCVIMGKDLEGQVYPDVHYRKMRGPLNRQLASVMREMEDLKIGLVIIDSVGLAMGAKESNYEDQAIQFYETLRYLEPAAILLVDHVTGADVRDGSKIAGKAFGSIYKMAEARAAWEVRKQQDTDSAEQIIGLHHTKHNHTRKYGSIGFRLDFETDDDELRAVRISYSDLKESDELVRQLSAPEQIEAMLRDGAESLDEITDQVFDGKRDIARATVNRMVRNGKLVSLPDKRYGLAERPVPPYLKPLP